MGQYFFEEDPKVKETKGKILFEETIPYYFERFDKLAKENNGHLVLGRVCLEISKTKQLLKRRASVTAYMG